MSLEDGTSVSVSLSVSVGECVRSTWCVGVHVFRRPLWTGGKLTGARRLEPLFVSMTVAPLLVMQPMAAQIPRFPQLLKID